MQNFLHVLIMFSKSVLEIQIYPCILKLNILDINTFWGTLRFTPDAQAGLHIETKWADIFFMPIGCDQGRRYWERVGGGGGGGGENWGKKGENSENLLLKLLSQTLNCSWALVWSRTHMYVARTNQYSSYPSLCHLSFGSSMVKASFIYV